MNYTSLKRIVIFILLCLIMLFGPICKINAFDSVDYLDFDRINEYIQAEMSQGKIQGLAVCIVKGNEIAYLKGYGQSGNNRKVDISTPFCIGSVSKTFTSLAIRQMINENKLNVQSPVNNYIKDFHPIYEGNEVNPTVYQLLTHTSGFSIKQGWFPYLYNSAYSIREVVEKSNSLNINTKPGTSYEYSNLNYILLGRIIEIVSGLSYKDYVKSNIFEKLDMEHSYTDEAIAVKNGLSQGYTILYGLPVPSHYAYPEGSLPAGFIFASIEDMANYLICFLNKGFYKDNSVVMDPSASKLENFMENSYLSNWYDQNWIENYGAPRNDLYLDSYGYNGATPNYTASFLINQKSRYGVVVMNNTHDQVNFFDRDIDSSTICRGIMEYLESGEIPQVEPVKTNYTRLFPIASIILIMIIYTFMSIRCVFVAKGRKTGFRYFLIDIILPVVAFVAIPFYNESNWSWLLASNPEVNYIIIGVILWLMLLAFIKISIHGERQSMTIV